MDESQLLGKLEDLDDVAVQVLPDNRLRIPPVRVPAAWCDYNGHMNVAFYVARFDQNLDLVFRRLNMSHDYVTSRGHSHFTVEGHIRYLAELREGEELYMDYLMLDASDKVIHYYAEMRGPGDRLAATWEQLTLHVSMETRRSAPMPPDIAELVRSHLYTGPRPEHAGAMGVRRK